MPGEEEQARGVITHRREAFESGDRGPCDETTEIVIGQALDALPDPGRDFFGRNAVEQIVADIGDQGAALAVENLIQGVPQPAVADAG